MSRRPWTFYFLDGQAPIGPVSFYAARKKVSAGKITPESWICRVGATRWSEAKSFRALFQKSGREIFQKFLNGEVNIATARAELQDYLECAGFTTDTFLPDEKRLVPPVMLQSFCSRSYNERTDVILKTKLEIIANRRFREVGSRPGSLFSWPCYELVRVLYGEEAIDWPQRWEACGGRLFRGRMIARKADPIWKALGSRKNFDDALDTDVPPFAFNSGYGWREIGRDEAVALGVILPDDKVDAQNLRMNKGLSVNAQKFDTEFLKACRADLDVAIAKGRLSLK